MSPYRVVQTLTARIWKKARLEEDQVHSSYVNLMILEFYEAI